MKTIITALMLLSLCACNSGTTSASELYSGSETGSWYSLGASCVNGVCPIN